MNLLTRITAVLLGLAAGGLILIGLGLLPYWRSLDPDAFTQLFIGNVPYIAKTMATLGFSSASLTLLVTIFSVKKKLPTRRWFIAASIFALCMLIVFPVYFKDTNAAFASGTMSAAEITTELATWQIVHWIRTIAAIAACFCVVSAGYSKNN